MVDVSPDRPVTWLAAGTPIRYWALHDGRDPRSVPVDARFTQPLTTAPRAWRGGGVLRVVTPGVPFQVMHFWDPTGRFAGWYVNFESPVVRTGDRLEAVDWFLDLWLDPDRTATWKDEEEAARAVLAGLLAPEDLAAARAAGQRVLDDVDAWLRLVGDWRDFAPDPTWTPPPLPADWES
ncbi:DUF402 domain-containing protein [Blastococcus sp. SYSU DS0617]